MNRLRDNFATRPDDRAGDLIGADQPLTPADLRLRAWVWRALIAYVLAAFAVGIWALSVLITAVF
jgi:hypothetical protein